MLMMFCEKLLRPPVLKLGIEITEVEPQASHQGIPDIVFDHMQGLLTQFTQSHRSSGGNSDYAPSVVAKVHDSHRHKLTRSIIVKIGSVQYDHWRVGARSG